MSTLAELSVEIGAKLDKFEAGMRRVEDRLDDVAKSASKSNKATESTYVSLAKAAGSAFALEKAVALGREIVNVTAKYQKFAATLETALGSSSRAQAAMARLQAFAATTPFQVDQLTDSFVKLANRGINASSSQMTKMGDLASALGKDFGVLTEAILDVNNTERWNELGIKVKTVGDTIEGTFKGVTQVFEKSERGALKMVEAFGSMQGVAGGMEKQSATLGGAISNLDDSLDGLFATIGGQGSGVMIGAVKLMSEYVNWIKEAIKSSDQLSKDAIARETDSFAQNFDSGGRDTKKAYFQNQEAKAKKLRAEYEKLQAATANLVATEQQYVVVGMSVQENQKIALAKAAEADKKLQLDAVMAKLDYAKQYYQQEAQVFNQAASKRTEEEKKIQAEREKILSSAISKIEEQLKSAANAASIFSDTGVFFDLTAEKAKILETGIKSLSDLGFTKGSAVVQNYIGQLNTLGQTIEQQKEKFSSIESIINPAKVKTGGISSIPLGAPKTTGSNVNQQALDLAARMQAITDAGRELEAFAQGAIGPAFEQLGMVMGNALASGGDGLAAALQGILGMLADFAMQYGKKLIAIGVAMNLAFPGSGTGKIIGGVALIAAGAAAKALKIGGGGKKTPALAHGGLAYGPTLAMVGDNRNAASNPEVIAPLSDLKNMIGGGSGEVVFRIGNNELVGTLRRQATGADLRGKPTNVNKRL